VPGDHGIWVKSKCLNREEFVVVGWTDPERIPYVGFDHQWRDGRRPSVRNIQWQPYEHREGLGSQRPNLVVVRGSGPDYFTGEATGALGGDSIRVSFKSKSSKACNYVFDLKPASTATPAELLKGS
jgi:hypothetical protein